MVSWILWKDNTYGMMDALRYGCFQVVSILTTTGFTTADYELWPQAAQMFISAVCFIGACAGFRLFPAADTHGVAVDQPGIFAACQNQPSHNTFPAGIQL